MLVKVESCKNCPFHVNYPGEKNRYFCNHPKNEWGNNKEVLHYYQIPIGCPLKSQPVSIELMEK